MQCDSCFKHVAAGFGTLFRIHCEENHVDHTGTAVPGPCCEIQPGSFYCAECCPDVIKDAWEAKQIHGTPAKSQKEIEETIDEEVREEIVRGMSAESLENDGTLRDLGSDWANYYFGGRI